MLSFCIHITRHTVEICIGPFPNHCIRLSQTYNFNRVSWPSNCIPDYFTPIILFLKSATCHIPATVSCSPLKLHLVDSLCSHAPRCSNVVFVRFLPRRRIWEWVAYLIVQNTEGLRASLATVIYLKYNPSLSPSWAPPTADDNTIRGVVIVRECCRNWNPNKVR